MYMEKKAHISWRTHQCYKCNEETVTTGGGSVNGWLPMSRREQRRARKARKNLVMYKLAGQRPWSADSWDGTHNSLGDKLLCQRDRHGGRACRGIDDWCMCDGEQRSMHAERMDHLRERSGFLDMSRRAHEMALTKAHERAYTDEAVSYTSERFKELLAAFTLDINAAASAGLSIYDDTEPRTAGCQCQWEAGDSPCRVHGENEEATP